jgi:hypothetical protein
MATTSIKTIIKVRDLYFAFEFLKLTQILIKLTFSTDSGPFFLSIFDKKIITQNVQYSVSFVFEN